MSEYADYDDPPDVWEGRMDGPARFAAEQRRIMMGCTAVVATLLGVVLAAVFYAVRALFH